jgi:hypothetical protein
MRTLTRLIAAADDAQEIERLKLERYDLLQAHCARQNALRRAAYADQEARLTRRISEATCPDEVEQLKLKRYELRKASERRLTAARAKNRALKKVERWRHGPRKRVLTPTG